MKPNSFIQLTLSVLIGLTSISSSMAKDTTDAKSPIKSKKELKQAALAKIKTITSPELKKSLAQDSTILLIDIRTEGEFLAGHLDKAVWMPRGKLEFLLLKKKLTDPNRRIVLYCRTGTRSYLAAAALQDMGYKNVVALKGGFAGWTDEGYTFYNRHGELKMIDFENENKKAAAKSQ